MVRVGIALSALVGVGWIAASMYLIRTEEGLPPALLVILAAGWAFLALIVVWAAVALVGWVRRVTRAARAMRGDDNFAKPS